MKNNRKWDEEIDMVQEIHILVVDLYIAEFSPVKYAKFHGVNPM